MRRSPCRPWSRSSSRTTPPAASPPTSGAPSSESCCTESSKGETRTPPISDQQPAPAPCRRNLPGSNGFCVCREPGLDEVCHQLCVCNAARDALEGEVLSVRFQQLLLRPSKAMVDFLLEVGRRGGRSGSWPPSSPLSAVLELILSLPAAGLQAFPGPRPAV